jgi:hypothetical protein
MRFHGVVRLIPDLGPTTKRKIVEEKEKCKRDYACLLREHLRFQRIPSKHPCLLVIRRGAGCSRSTATYPPDSNAIFPGRFALIPVSFEALENRESFGILSSTIAEEMSVFEGILSLTRTVSHELTSLFLFPAIASPPRCHVRLG